MDEIKINFIADGYNYLNTNCVDNSIAWGCGCFRKEFYYFYCFYYCLQANWNTIDINNFSTHANTIMKPMGLYLKTIKIFDFNAFKEAVCHNIELGLPVFFPTVCKECFYLIEAHRESNTNGHYIFITGFDHETGVFFISDSAINRQNMLQYYNSQPIIQIALREKDMYDIFESTKEYFKNEDNDYLNSLVVIKKLTIKLNKQMTGFIDIFYDLIDNYNYLNNNLVTAINQIYDDINILKFEKNIAFLRSSHIFSFNVFFDCFEKAFEKLLDDISLKSKYEILKKKYINSKDLLLSKLLKISLSNRRVLESQKKDMIEGVLQYDKSLFDFVKYCIKKYEEQFLKQKI